MRIFDIFSKIFSDFCKLSRFLPLKSSRFFKLGQRADQQHPENKYGETDRHDGDLNYNYGKVHNW